MYVFELYKYGINQTDYVQNSLRPSNVFIVRLTYCYPNRGLSYRSNIEILIILCYQSNYIRMFVYIEAVKHYHTFVHLRVLLLVFHIR